ncbi:hypothetical protein [Burkholderia sp. LMG 13014]|uniref:hypothetical protein n=1 Tax=Burkholderia sp. LMG 13014 TaxID=2709306 RepID=UPI001964DE70|nr:hypothetical protein [Burkholderia sp. LMG 13014]
MESKEYEFLVAVWIGDEHKLFGFETEEDQKGFINDLEDFLPEAQYFVGTVMKSAHQEFIDNSRHKEVVEDFESGNFNKQGLYTLYGKGSLHFSNKPFHALDYGNYTAEDSEDDGYHD